MFTPERGPSSLGFLTRSPGWHLRRPGSLQSPPKAAPPLVNAGHDTVEKGVRQKQYSDVDALAMRLNIDINMIHISIYSILQLLLVPGMVSVCLDLQSGSMCFFLPHSSRQ